MSKTEKSSNPFTWNLYCKQHPSKGEDSLACQQPVGQPDGSTGCKDPTPKRKKTSGFQKSTPRVYMQTDSVNICVIRVQIGIIKCFQKMWVGTRVHSYSLFAHFCSSDFFKFLGFKFSPPRLALTKVTYLINRTMQPLETQVLHKANSVDPRPSTRAPACLASGIHSLECCSQRYPLTEQSVTQIDSGNASLYLILKEEFATLTIPSYG